MRTVLAKLTPLKMWIYPSCSTSIPFSCLIIFAIIPYSASEPWLSMPSYGFLVDFIIFFFLITLSGMKPGRLGREGLANNHYSNVDPKDPHCQWVVIEIAFIDNPHHQHAISTTDTSSPPKVNKGIMSEKLPTTHRTD